MQSGSPFWDHYYEDGSARQVAWDMGNSLVPYYHPNSSEDLFKLYQLVSAEDLVPAVNIIISFIYTKCCLLIC